MIILLLSPLPKLKLHNTYSAWLGTCFISLKLTSIYVRMKMLTIATTHIAKIVITNWTSSYAFTIAILSTLPIL
ncbi:hypothetical protein BGZ60DRAFT_281536 [Tricladium varicosporioides]|nr:hypothetical protein BGZ60DRAFT_281536 [Hymenoscyphus varicosporioides]